MNKKRIVYSSGIINPDNLNKGDVVAIKYKSLNRKDYGKYRGFTPPNHSGVWMLYVDNFINSDNPYKIENKLSLHLIGDNAEVWLADQEEIEIYNRLCNSAREKEILKTSSEDQTQLEDRPKTGYKNDRLDDKLRWELLPWQEIEDIVKVYHFGAKKYAPESWKNLNDGARRYFAACNRHLIAYIKGEKIDPESGIYHLAHAAWNVIAMLYLDKHGNGFDFDRVKTDKFIEKACIVHNNKYKYPNTIYVKNDEKVEIECPIHGAFWQTPHNHLNGAGCPKCRNGIAKRFICGSGVNDLNSARNERSYNIWMHLMKRCCGKRRPKAYKDCKICDEWKLYSNFKKFYDKYCKNDSFHLDKDILVQGNKLYSPDTCVFVPIEINETIQSIWVEDRSLPAGVSMTKCGKFRARCRKGEGLDREHIGCYDTAEEAFEEYRKAKKERIKEMANRHFRNGDIDKKVYDALISYKIYPFPFGDKRNDDYLINEKKIF